MYVVEDIPDPHSLLPPPLLADLGFKGIPSGTLITDTVTRPEFLRVFRSDTFRFAWAQSGDTEEIKLVAVAGYIPNALYDRLIGQRWIALEERFPQDWPEHRISFICHPRLYDRDALILKVQVEDWFDRWRPIPYKSIK